MSSTKNDLKVLGYMVENFNIWHILSAKDDLNKLLRIKSYNIINELIKNKNDKIDPK